MKKNLSITVILFLTRMISFGQAMNTVEDSIKNLLCHKWGVKAIIMAGQELTNMNETVTYQFNKDNTFTRVADKKTENGTWSYEGENNRVHLILKKKTSLYILGLKQGQFDLITESQLNSSNDKLGTRIVFKTVE